MTLARNQWLKFLSATLLALWIGLGGVIAVGADEPIVSTLVGEIPTTGGMRPGPIGLEPESTQQQQGVVPVSISIEKAAVNASIETNQIENGVMLDPTGPWVISWYKESSMLGETGNILMAGHLDYWDVGPAVLYNVGLLEKGDLIQVTGDDGELFTYEVMWRENYDTATAPLGDIVGPTDNESLTLITCGGPFDYTNGVYLQRTVVRAHRVITA